MVSCSKLSKWKEQTGSTGQLVGKHHTISGFPSISMLAMPRTSAATVFSQIIKFSLDPWAEGWENFLAVSKVPGFWRKGLIRGNASRITSYSQWKALNIGFKENKLESESHPLLQQWAIFSSQRKDLALIPLRITTFKSYTLFSEFWEKKSPKRK